MVDSEEVEAVVRARQPAIGEQECGIADDGLAEETHGLEEILRPGGAAGFGVDQCRRANVKIERHEISSGSLLDRGLFRRREPGLKLVGDCLGNFALNGKNIRKLSVIGLRPQMRIGAGVDQLRHHSHAVGCALNAPFQHMGHAELLSDFPQVPRITAFVEHDGSATDDL